MSTHHSVLTVSHLSKYFGDFRAVDDLSFEVHSGEVFGLLGPNGAGKTTAIRAIMDIARGDEGSITLFGQPPQMVREQIGYLPEERGLYRDLKVIDVMVYLAALKGTSRSEARRRAMRWLERVDLLPRALDRVRDLSGGMQQKLQIVSCLVHGPDLLILDEPFQALDPVNVDLVKGLIRELQKEGKTIVLSAHQMNLVEALCDRIVLINRGKAVLYGTLGEIKQRYAAQTVRLRTTAALEPLPGIAEIKPIENHTYTLTLKDASAQQVLATLVKQGVEIESFEVASAPLEEIFIAVVREGNHA
jgi:ABC-2 type transport system ATP-binding protein